MQSSFIGKLSGQNILHMHKDSNQASVTPDINSIFHSKLPHIFITKKTRINQYANMAGYRIFDVRNILPQLDQAGVVYLIRLNYANGVQRLLGCGVSSVQEFNQYGSSTQYIADISEYFFSAQSIDLYSQQMWLPYSSNDLDQCAQNRACQQHLYRNRQSFPVSQQGSPGQAIGAVQQILYDQFVQGCSTSNIQWQKGSNSKGFLAIRDGWYWPHFSYSLSSPQGTFQSNYSSVEDIYGGSRGFYSLFSASGGINWSHVGQSGVEISSIDILETNLRNGSELYQLNLTSSQGEIKVSNTDFTIGGLNLRQSGYSLITTVGSTVRTNYQGQGDSSVFHTGYCNWGVDIFDIPPNSSWQLDSTQGSISVGGYQLWNKNNPPLKFLGTNNFHIPQTKIVISNTPQKLGQIQLGGSGTMVLLFNARSVSQSTLYPGAVQASAISSGIQVGARVPINNGGYDGWQNYGILTIPQGHMVPIQQVISSSPQGIPESTLSRNYQVQKTWLYNQGGGVIEFFQNLTTPSNLSHLSPDIYTQGLDIFAARLV